MLPKLAKSKAFLEPSVINCDRAALGRTPLSSLDQSLSFITSSKTHERAVASSVSNECSNTENMAGSKSSANVSFCS
jgi:hypothetical protein